MLPPSPPENTTRVTITSPPNSPPHSYLQAPSGLTTTVNLPAAPVYSVPSTPTTSSFIKSKYLHGRALNTPHRKWLRLERNPAINTKVTMEFFDYNGEELPINKISAKWVSAPEPLTPHRDDFDSSKLALLYRETILSDEEGEPFDIAIKHEGETQCYAMTGETYQKVNDNRILYNTLFLIDKQRFRVRVVAISGIHYSNPKTFVIDNVGTSLEKFKISVIES